MNRRLLWLLSFASLTLAGLEAPQAVNVVTSEWRGPYEDPGLGGLVFAAGEASDQAGGEAQAGERIEATTVAFELASAPGRRGG